MIDTFTSGGNSWRKKKRYDARRDGGEGSEGKMSEKRKEQELR